jgi:hypothetical protein
MDKLIPEIRALFQKCNANLALLQFSQSVEASVVSHFSGEMTSLSSYKFQAMSGQRTTKLNYRNSLIHLIADREAPLSVIELLDDYAWRILHDQCCWKSRPSGGNACGVAQMDQLFSLCEKLGASDSALIQRYGEDLESSVCALQASETSEPTSNPAPTLAHRVLHRDSCQRVLQAMLTSIKVALAPLSSIDRTISSSGQWPEFTERAAFKILSQKDLPEAWKTSLAIYSRFFLLYQQAQRLVHVRENNAIIKELSGQIISLDEALRFPIWVQIQASCFFVCKLSLRTYPFYLL